MKHTPGPWHDDGYRIYAPTTEEDKRCGRVIVEYKHVCDFNSADAPLIAAAPELLEALNLVIASYERAYQALTEGSYGFESMPSVKKARAAIAKAES